MVVGSDGRTDMRAGKAERLVVLATGVMEPTVHEDCPLYIVNVPSAALCTR